MRERRFDTILSNAARAAFCAALAMTLPALAGEARYEGAILSDVRNAEKTRDSFTPDTKKIILTAQLADVPNGAKLTAAWYVEKAAGIAPDSKLASSDVVARAQMNSATFSVNRPGIGWPPGDYRVELLIDDKPNYTARFRIAP